MKYFIIPAILFLSSCKEDKIEKVEVHFNKVHYNLTEGSGSHYTWNSKRRMKKVNFKFHIPRKELDNIKFEYYKNKLDTINTEADYSYKKTYSNVYGERLLLITLSMKNGDKKEIGYSGPIDSTPDIEFVATTFRICSRIRDSLKLRPASW